MSCFFLTRSWFANHLGNVSLKKLLHVFGHFVVWHVEAIILYRPLPSELIQESSIGQVLQSDLVWTHKWPGLKWPPFGGWFQVTLKKLGVHIFCLEEWWSLHGAIPHLAQSVKIFCEFASMRGDVLHLSYAAIAMYLSRFMVLAIISTFR